MRKGDTELASSVSSDECVGVFLFCPADVWFLFCFHVLSSTGSYYLRSRVVFFRFCLERDLLLHVDEHSRSTWGLEETTFFPSQKGALLLLFFRCFPYSPPLTDVPLPFRVVGEDPIQNWIISSCHVM
jgi:hypothetical protein